MLKKDRPAIPELFTGRLVLRKLIPGDNLDLLLLRSDDRVNRYIDRPKMETVDECLAFIDRISKSVFNQESYYWAISRKQENRLIGTICIWNISAEDNSAEIGFEMHPDHQGYGFMSEAITEIIPFGFDKLHLHRIDAWINQENTASIKLIKKHKFLRNNVLEEKHKELSELKSTFIFSLASSVFTAA